MHPHLQVWLGEQYEGQFGQHQHASDQYHRDTGHDYWSHLLSVHMELGLGVRVGEVSVIAPLTSHKDYELMMISDKVDQDFITVFTVIMNMFSGVLGLYCRSMSMSWPSLDPGVSGPAVLRVGSRGSCVSDINDVSSLELYSVFSVNVDPVTTINTLKQTLINHRL